MDLRVGPYVCAEWDFGGIPAWVGLKPGISLRTTEPQWIKLSGGFFDTVVRRLAPLFSDNGGPVVMVQVG